MEFFQRLGSLVSRLWKERNYNEEHFPEVASRGLSELPPDLHVTFWDVTKWALTCERLPGQADLSAKFGQPPLTVFVGRDFRIEVLFWVQGIPAIHQHSFSGAFHVMHGSSLQCLWGFEPSEQVAMRLALGRVSLKKAELLRKGDSRPIIAGRQLIHSTFHLDRPSLTVVVRTLGEIDQLPQYSYLPPTIAYAQDHDVPSVLRRTQLLRMLLISGKRAEYNEIAHHVFGTEDAYSVFQFLLNIPERPAILNLVEQRYPSRDPITAILTWARELSELGVFGVRFTEPWLLMLQCLLMKSSGRETQEAFSGRYGTKQIPNLESGLGELSSGLQDSWLLQPVFQN